MRSLRFRAAVLLLLAACLPLTGAGHVVLHGSAAHGVHGGPHVATDSGGADGCAATHGRSPADEDREDGPADEPVDEESDGHCVLCHLQLAGGFQAVAAVSATQDAAPARELGPEAPHAASTRGRASPRAPPERA